MRAFLLGLFLGFFLDSFCQGTQYKVHKVQTGFWNNYLQDWTDLKNSYPYEMYVTFHGNLIVVGDANKSYYRCDIQLESNKTNFNFTGYDEDDKMVLLSLYQEEEGYRTNWVFLVAYRKNFFVKYYITNN